MHSAGHGSIIKIVNEINRENIDSKIKIILNVSNLKKDIGYENRNYADFKAREKKSNNPEKIDGCWFWRSSDEDATRKHIWLPRDESILKELYEKNIMFFNPREDRIRINELDFIISNKGWHAIKDEVQDNQNRNINEFHRIIDEWNKACEEDIANSDSRSN